jgi:hypothetical protein
MQDHGAAAAATGPSIEGRRQESESANALFYPYTGCFRQYGLITLVGQWLVQAGCSPVQKAQLLHVASTGVAHEKMRSY